MPFQNVYFECLAWFVFGQIDFKPAWSPIRFSQ